MGDPCELQGANWVIWHGSLFIAGTAPTGGITLVALYSDWAAGMEDRLYKKISTFTLWGTQCANGSESWGTHPPHVW